MIMKDEVTATLAAASGSSCSFYLEGGLVYFAHSHSDRFSLGG
jgi:hypothetical protein